MLLFTLEREKRECPRVWELVTEWNSPEFHQGTIGCSGRHSFLGSSGMLFGKRAVDSGPPFLEESGIADCFRGAFSTSSLKDAIELWKACVTRVGEDGIRSNSANH